jgi:uncharacterized membrane protein YeiB
MKKIPIFVIMKKVGFIFYLLYKNPGKTIWIVLTGILIFFSLTLETKTISETEVVGEAYINKELWGYISVSEKKGYHLINKENTKLNGTKLEYKTDDIFWVLSTALGWLSFIIMLLLFILTFSDDNWNIDYVREDYWIKEIKSFYEDGNCIYIFRNRLILSTKSNASKSQIQLQIREYFSSKEVFPEYKPLQVRREEKLKKLIG